MRVRIQILVGKWCLTLILASYTDIAASWSDFLKIFIIYLWCRFHKCMSWLQRTGSLKWYLFFLFKSLTPWVLFIKEIVTFFYVLLLCRLSPRIDSMLSWTCIWGKKMCQSKSLLCFSIGIWTDLMCCHWMYHLMGHSVYFQVRFITEKFEGQKQLLYTGTAFI